MIDIGEHFLVPKHQVLTDEAKTSFLKEYSINELQVISLPKKLKYNTTNEFAMCYYSSSVRFDDQ